MKSTKFYISLTLIAVASLIASCNKDVASTEILTPLTPSKLDENAGAWKMIFMTSATQFPVAAPTAVTSAAYLTELADVKVRQANITKDQQAIVDYWSAGGVLRWNQIFRGLVAKYNLPPAPRADGSYIFPDADLPFTDPQFPFATPPYAARAYSYVSVVIADALKAAWYYKYLYNRAAPYTVDSGIQALVPKTTLPAYPSEDAVISGAAAEMLKLLFPAALEEISLRASEQVTAAWLSGKAAKSDISAGLTLGKAVVASISSTTSVPAGRFRADGMGATIGNAAQWQALADKRTALGEIPWISLDSPARPPMLPNFGAVKAWNMTPANIVSERPTAPPSTSSAEMQAQVAEVKSYADNVTREQMAIVHKWADGAGTYTPPGHWNDIAEEYIRDSNFSEVRAARAFALLNMAMHDAAVGCWETKYFYFNPRPTQLNPTIKTTTGIPNFPAYTSGHSTFSAAAASVLSYLFPAGAADFDAQAKEASISRLYGAIHYRIDTEMGLAHGKKIATYTLSWAATDGAN
jgi:hypothetical protein